jgi:hypothetical protein
MSSERPSSPPDELNDSWFDRPGRRRRIRLPPIDPEAPDSDAGDDLDDPWFVWSPEV